MGVKIIQEKECGWKERKSDKYFIHAYKTWLTRGFIVVKCYRVKLRMVRVETELRCYHKG